MLRKNEILALTICIVALTSFSLPVASAAPSVTTSRICVNSASGTIVARKRCRGNEDRLSADDIPNPSGVFHVAASGTPYTSLASAITAATVAGASATNPMVVKVAAGVFALPSTALQMASYINIDGSGPGSTVLTVTGSTGIQLANNARLSNLKITSSLTSDMVMLSAQSAGATYYLDNIQLDYSGSGSASSVTGLEITAGTAIVRNLRAVLSHSASNASIMGISIANSASSFEGTDCHLDVQAHTPFALHVGNSGVTTVTDSTLITRGTTTGVDPQGVPAFIINTSAAVLFRNVHLLATNIGSANEALFVNAGTNVKIENSRIVSQPADSGGNGAVAVLGGGSAAILSSTIETEETSSTVLASDSSSVQIGGSRMSGGATATTTGGTITCAGVYDEDFVFSASTCPS